MGKTKWGGERDIRWKKKKNKGLIWSRLRCLGGIWSILTGLVWRGPLENCVENPEEIGPNFCPLQTALRFDCQPRGSWVGVSSSICVLAVSWWFISFPVSSSDNSVPDQVVQELVFCPFCLAWHPVLACHSPCRRDTINICFLKPIHQTLEVLSQKESKRWPWLTTVHKHGKNSDFRSLWPQKTSFSHHETSIWWILVQNLRGSRPSIRNCV